MGLNHHRTHKNKPITFDRHHYLKDIFINQCPVKVMMKSTQCGITEYLIVDSIEDAYSGRSVFYVLPTDSLKNRFVRNRYNRSLSYSPFYRKIVSETKTNMDKANESMSLKDIGRGVVALVGSNTPNPFTEFPADTFIVDEKDRCDQSNLLMGEERLSHSDRWRKVFVSNPTIKDFGIHEDFKISDQRHWNIKCNRCGEWIQPDFFTHVVSRVGDSDYRVLDKNWYPETMEEINMICNHCNKPFDRFANGEWVSHYPNRTNVAGWQINKLFSSNAMVLEVLDRFNKGLSNDDAMQRFYNGDLGLPYTEDGASITIDMMNNCIDVYNLPPEGLPHEVNAGDVVLMGVDVGSKLHTIIAKMVQDRKLKVIYIGSVNEPEDILSLAKRFKVTAGVIDALPETRMSRKLSAWIKRMFMAYYSDVKRDVFDPKSKTITVERTQALDAVKEAYLLKEVVLPMNCASIPEYYDHMTASTRIYNEDKNKYQWVEGNKPDHFFHANSYLMLAKKLFLMLGGRTAGGK
jgi:hypothetical protein